MENTKRISLDECIKNFNGKISFIDTCNNKIKKRYKICIVTWIEIG